MHAGACHIVKSAGTHGHLTPLPRPPSAARISNRIRWVKRNWKEVNGFPIFRWLVVQLNPLSYGVDGLRGALTSGFVFGVATDFAVLGGLAAILLAIGAYLFSKIEV
jgi:hypothetical protein